MFTVSGDVMRQSKSARAALQLSVGRFHRWMCDVRLGKFIHEYVLSRSPWNVRSRLKFMRAFQFDPGI